MAHFYGEIINPNQKTISKKAGSKKSGLSAHIRGWEGGVYISVTHSNGKDTYRIYETGGSNDPSKKRLISAITFV